MATKKHYELLAKIIRAHVAAEQLAGNRLLPEKDLVTLVSRALARDNPRFDAQRFREACGLERLPA